MSKKPLKAIYGSPDRLLKAGNVDVECYVLENGARVLSGRGMQNAVGLGKGVMTHGSKLREFIKQKDIKPFVSNDLAMAIEQPVYFIRPSRGGKPAIAFEATLLIDFCQTIMRAYNNRAMNNKSLLLVKQAQAITTAYAKTGIIAVIDEITGYQDVRAKGALATILEKFIEKELQPWTKTFPYEFYEQIYRLKGWPGAKIPRRPSVIGRYTNDIVYDRLAPGILDELKRLNPIQKSGARKHKHHQWFTTDIGHPKLKEHLAAVIALMRASPNWNAFNRNLVRAFPMIGEMQTLPENNPKED